MRQNRRENEYPDDTYDDYFKEEDDDSKQEEELPLRRKYRESGMNGSYDGGYQDTDDDELSDEFSDEDGYTSPKKKRDPKFDLLIVQIVSCVVLLLMAFGIKFFGGDFFTEVKAEYIQKFEDPTTIDEVIQSMAGVFDMTARDDTSGSGGSPDQSSNAESTVSGTDISLPATDPAGAAGTGGGDDNQSNTDASSAGASSAATVSPVSTIPMGEEEEDNTAYVFDFSTVKTSMNMTGGKANSLLTPVVGTVTSHFGYRTHPVTGLYTMHGGLDIGADEGTDIRAAMAGVVKSVAQSNSYGIYIVLDHQNGMETWYAHCSKIIAKEGQTVQKGDKIAKVGNTGVSTGPHLHFEVRVQGTKLNPEWLLAPLSNT